MPIRVRVMGEDLIAFRDTNGRVELVDAYCPHRGAPRPATHYQRHPANGTKGRFELRKIKDGLVLDEKTGKRRYATVDLRERIELVFLRIRRKMTE